MIVIKVGGSILKDKEDIVSLPKIIGELNKNEKIIIIVSALNGVTNLLIEGTKNEEEIDKIAIEVYNKYSKFISMFGDDKNSKEALLKLKRELLKTAKMIKAEKSNQNAKNKFISYGEKMSTIVLHSILMQNGISSIPVINPILFTYKKQGDDLVNQKKTKAILRNAIKNNNITIVPGFIGIDKNGYSTIIGRGGSDYTATIIAKILNINKVILITDVPGIMTSDPRIIDNPVTIKYLSVGEAVELAHLGAKKFHPKTFEPIINTSISVIIRCLYSNDTTTISESYQVNSLKGITFTKDLTEIKIESLNIVGRIGSASHIINLVKKCNVNIISLAQPISETTIQIFIKKEDENRLIKELKKDQYIKKIEINSVSAISVVGNKLSDNIINAKMIKMAAEHNLISFSRGINNISSTFILDSEKGENFFYDLHDKLKKGKI